MRVLGVSGSPTKDSNTDALIKAVLSTTGAETEFIKLSEIKVGPCIACMKCVYTNECVINDDFKWLSRKVMEADAIVVGSPTYYGSASAFMKAFIERLYSKRHIKLLMRGKLAATVAVGVAAEKMVAEWMGNSLRAGGMEIVGSMTAKGTPCCFVCGPGETCDYTVWNAYSKELTGMDLGVGEAYKEYLEILPDNVPYAHGSAKFLKSYRSVKDEPPVMAEAERIGKLIRERE
ncbi:NADPH-dependent FMN reductase [Candidatus Methanoperedens nitroreducens]|uniref:NADPH-dependent FMN reductase n=1 Tax=Candidatus Methanoperedens nitratireducens TaxID=1392998 RepID=A0A062UZD6_9EURY|nr:flavodoxin family protein [Candidatus Methanoperedens nitroreducens]KCZ70502.1 NADPH-dependent FMN reductase [Candidatus Methanoperedens nitroreducens]MDJ1420353.1 flavodoxin family protein [Candidatus Methanoperedens sp.]